MIDDRTLQEASARRYRAVVVPRVKLMPDSTRRWLADYAAAGGTVVTDRDGEDLGARLAAAVPADVALDPPTPAIGFVHRRLRDADLYFLANTSNTARTVRARFGSQTESGESWDPMSGAIEPLDVTGAASLTFEPYGSRVIVFRRRARALERPLVRQGIDGAAVGLDVSGGTWVRLQPDLLRPAPSICRTRGRTIRATRFFSGTASYRRSAQLPPAFRAAGARVFLDFGDGRAVEREALPGGTMRGNSFAALIAPPIREAATVFVNARRAGRSGRRRSASTSPIFLRDGSNDIRIDVYNTAINQLAEGGRLPDVAAVTERYGQRFRLQDVDTSRRSRQAS